jgi:hypothetical protein
MFEKPLTYPCGSVLLEVEQRFDSGEQEDVMSRTYRGDRTVHVRCAEGRPAQFIWRDRLYRVHRVLQEWDRSAIWWKDVRAVASGPSGCDVQTWRVEASAGRMASRGVYELSFDPADDQWHLVRTYD